MRGRRLRLPAADVGQIFLIGVLGVAASNYFYYLAIQRTNVATAIIVQYTAPIWVLLYTVARGLQKPTLQRVAAVGLAVTGIALVIGVFGGGGLRLDTIGVIAGLLAAFSFAFYNIGGHNILARHRPLDCAALHHLQRLPVLDRGQPAMEDHRSALFGRTVAFPAAVLADLGAGPVFASILPDCSISSLHAPSW